MSTNEEKAPRLSGTGDIVWIAAISIVCALIVMMVLSHLQTSRHLWEISRERANELSEQRHLQNEERELRIEREIRANSIHLPAASERLGLGAVRPDQVRRAGDL